jgi:hypothetical protein
VPSDHYFTAPFSLPGPKKHSPPLRASEAPTSVQLRSGSAASAQELGGAVPDGIGDPP